MTFIEALIILIVVLLIFYFIKLLYHKFDTFSIRQNVLQESTVDGRKYYVHSKHENMVAAADTFAHINSTIDKFLSRLYDKYTRLNTSDISIFNRKRAVNLLISKYNPRNYRENSPKNIEKDTSYTINKGEIIAICIRGANTEIHDLTTLMFVVLHELTHLAVKDYDHPDDFWKTFKFILIEAEELIDYKSPDYLNFPVEYCGISITYNPRYDPVIKEI